MRDRQFWRSRLWMPLFSLALGGPGRDERWAAIDLRASAFAGLIVITAILGAWLWEIANGDDGSPYGQLGAIAGIAYIVVVAFLRRRS